MDDKTHRYALQAITCTYRGPTNSRGSRVLARSQAGRSTHPWDYALNPDQNMLKAAHAHAAKWGWPGRWVAGALPDGGAVYVRLMDDTTHLGRRDTTEAWVTERPGGGA